MINDEFEISDIFGITTPVNILEHYLYSFLPLLNLNDVRRLENDIKY